MSMFDKIFGSNEVRPPKRSDSIAQRATSLLAAIDADPFDIPEELVPELTLALREVSLGTSIVVLSEESISRAIIDPMLYSKPGDTLALRASHHQAEYASEIARATAEARSRGLYLRIAPTPITLSFTKYFDAGIARFHKDARREIAEFVSRLIKSYSDTQAMLWKGMSESDHLYWREGTHFNLFLIRTDGSEYTRNPPEVGSSGFLVAEV